MATKLHYLIEIPAAERHQPITDYCLLSDWFLVSAADDDDVSSSTEPYEAELDLLIFGVAVAAIIIIIILTQVQYFVLFLNIYV